MNDQFISKTKQATVRKATVTKATVRKEQTINQSNKITTASLIHKIKENQNLKQRESPMQQG